jgi:hypothetical protein
MEDQKRATDRFASTLVIAVDMALFGLFLAPVRILLPVPVKQISDGKQPCTLGKD